MTTAHAREGAVASGRRWFVKPRGRHAAKRQVTIEQGERTVMREQTERERSNSTSLFDTLLLFDPLVLGELRNTEDKHDAHESKRNWNSTSKKRTYIHQRENFEDREIEHTRPPSARFASCSKMVVAVGRSDAEKSHEIIAESFRKTPALKRYVCFPVLRDLSPR